MSIVLGVIFIVIVVPLFFTLYDRPTCYDGKKNGDEKGVDCGGSCQLLCESEAIAPNVLWSRAFKVTDGVYNAVAYLENRNINSEATASYVFDFYDKDNALIFSREGNIFIPKNKVFAVFEPDILVKEKIPYRVSFSFKGNLMWKKNLSESPDIAVVSKSLVGENTKPRVDAEIKNQSLGPVPKIEVVAIVYDDKENAIASSRTFIDALDKDQSQVVTFTWPTPFETREEVCRVPGSGVVGDRPQSLGVMIAIDRSGSMTALGKNPPQPLTDVKNAAVSFVNELRGTDEIGLVSFATEASEPIDMPLTGNYEALKGAISKISILPQGTQYTNIGDGILKAAKELLSPTKTNLTNHALILLTDGVATHPEKAGESDYPLVYAFEKAKEAKESGIEIYIIGLGSEVNKEFLETVATTPEHYFSAAASKDLKDIYEKIAVKICKIGPAVIEIIPRVIPANF